MSYDVLLFTSASSNYFATESEIRDNDGRVIHKFSDAAFVAIVPDEFDPSQLRHAGVTAPPTLDETSQLAASAWNSLQTDRVGRMLSMTEGLSWDAEGYQTPRHAGNDPELAAQPGVSSTGTATSLYMIGSIAVGVVIVSGTQSQYTVSQAERTTIVAEVIEGLDFLARIEPLARVTFVYDINFLTVTATPCSNPSTDSYEQCEAPWRDPALQQLGYTGSPAGIGEYVTALKTSKDTAWAYAAFFTKYPCHHFAYAGGQRLVMEYSNDNWGPSQINRLFAHETCHLFGAADEYGSCTCANSGQLSVPNNNCKNCTPNQVPCLMDANTLNMCQWTRGQLGWEWGIVGGSRVVTDKASKAPFVEVDRWGVQTESQIMLSHGFAWSEQYGSNTYTYTYGYLAPLQNPVASPHKKILVGGEIQVTNGSSTKPFITTSQWGQQTGEAVSLGNGIGWSSQYGADTYVYFRGYLGAALAPPRGTVLAGGRIRETSADSKKPFLDTSSWGSATSSETVFGGQSSWSEKYGVGYGYFSFFLLHV